MNCTTCQNELEDFLYGELSATQQVEVQRHLSGCPTCQAERDAREHEHQFFRSFYEQNTLEPSDELWTAIQARITKEPLNKLSLKTKLLHFLSPVLTPAALRQIGFASLLILISVGLTSLYFSLRKTEQLPIVVINPIPTPSVQIPIPSPETTIAPSPELITAKNIVRPIAKPVVKIADRRVSDDELLTRQIAKAGREYQNAITLLNRAIAKRQGEFDEATRLQYQASLQLIDKSIASSRQALRQHPNDPSAAQFLLSAYSKKVELMQEIAMR